MGELQEAVSRFTSIAEARRKQVQRFDVLAQEVRDLRKRVDEASAQPFTVILTELFGSLILSRDIPVLIQPTGDDFVATFVDAGISATGDTEAEAVFNLKDVIIQKYNFLNNAAESMLGKSPQRQLAVLRKIVKRAD